MIQLGRTEKEGMLVKYRSCLSLDRLGEARQRSNSQTNESNQQKVTRTSYAKEGQRRSKAMPNERKRQFSTGRSQRRRPDEQNWPTRTRLARRKIVVKKSKLWARAGQEERKAKIRPAQEATPNKGEQRRDMAIVSGLQFLRAMTASPKPGGHVRRRTRRSSWKVEDETLLVRGCRLTTLPRGRPLLRRGGL